MCTRPCVFSDHQFEAFRVVKLLQQLADNLSNLNFKGQVLFHVNY